MGVASEMRLYDELVLIAPPALPTVAGAEDTWPLRLPDEGEPEMVGRCARLVRRSTFDLGVMREDCRRAVEPDADDDELIEVGVEAGFSCRLATREIVWCGRSDM